MSLFKKYFKEIYLLLLMNFIAACQPSGNDFQNSTEKFKETSEYKIREITLSGEASLAEVEISGMTWLQDYVILLPQYPFKIGKNTFGEIYKIHKSRIIDFINGQNTNPIEPQRIKISGDGLTRFNNLGSGYEAIIFIGDEVYLTIESHEENKMMGYVVKGKINSASSEIILDASTLTNIDSQTDIHNLSEETIFSFNNQIFTLYEASGKNINPNPIVHKFDRNLKKLEPVNFINVEYRITDATTPSNDGKFWVINYMYSGDWQDLKPAEDEEFQKFGIGKSHKSLKNVERLLQLQISDSLIDRTGTPPLQIELAADGKGRNWEGIVKLENYGFLLVSDYYPRTILAYIEYARK